MNISNAEQTDKKYLFLPNTKNSPLNETIEKSQEKNQKLLPVIENIQILLQCFINATGSKVEESLMNNVNLLQDYFLELLYEKLDGIDIQHKITLCLDPLQCLVLVHKHPQEKEITERIKENNALSSIFSQISLHASALRNIHSLQSIATVGEFEEIAPRYYINLKGDMNHFYFY